MFQHTTVLKKEAVDALAVRPGGIYVDCTLGGGGHSEAIAERLVNGHLYAFDRDQTAIDAARQRLAGQAPVITFIRANFRFLTEELKERDVSTVDGILFDLGVSSPQFDRPERGFSYRYDGPLDMRMDRSQSLTAAQIVNEWPVNELAHIFFMYGEERFSKRIAREIGRRRSLKKIETTGELADTIREAVPAAARRTGGHPAKKTFQALRIAVNDELGSFEDALHQALGLLSVGGHMAIITFQSLEDRIAKQFIKKYSEPPDLPPGLPVTPADALPVLKKITRKPILPTAEELIKNRRAHSAKLRAAEKIRAAKEETTT